MTICYQCKHHQNMHFRTPEDHWTNQMCMASPVEQKQDPVSGFMIPADGYAFEFCKDVNTEGNCPKYEEKEATPTQS